MDLIIGAGITGLSYAFFSKNDDYIIIEQDSDVGGYCKTIKRNGFVWDYSGHFFHFQDEDIKDIILAGIPSDNLLQVSKSTKIQYKGELIDYPFQKNIHQLPKEEFIDCLYGLFNRKEGDDVTFKDMLYSKFGEGISNRFLVPYNEKLYACDLDTLDKDAMGRFFPYADVEEIIRNFKQSNNGYYNGSFIYPTGGAIEYVNSINNRIDSSKIMLDTKIVKVDMTQKMVYLNTGASISYDNLISTIPLPSLLKMCDIKYDHKAFSWNKVLVFNLGFNKKGNNTTDHWIYFPEKNLSFYRVGFYDNILNQDKMSVYVEIGFEKDAEINPKMWLGKVINDLRNENIIDDRFVLEDYEDIIMDPAYVHISKKSIDETKRVKDILKANDIYSIGRYGSWTYCSIEDNIKEARELAQKIG